ncbi:MAG: SLATT domain-containing protein, partial [Lachnospiraceae bacterium]|nr:SLATT domain-containing protein [Lachnospiraceae bacterium]
KESDRLRNIDIFLKSCGIVSLALSASGIFSVIIISSQVLAIISTVFTFLSLIVSINSMSCDFKATSTKHKKSALKFLTLRNALEVCLTDISYDRFSPEEMLKKKDYFEKKYTECCQTSLSASNIAVRRAKKALYNIRDNTYSNEEMEKIIPMHLRGNE